jgi:hypothetical protein
MQICVVSSINQNSAEKSKHDDESVNKNLPSWGHQREMEEN